jgi:hypothetical protein
VHAARSTSSGQLSLTLAHSSALGSTGWRGSPARLVTWARYLRTVFRASPVERAICFTRRPVCHCTRTSTTSFTSILLRATPVASSVASPRGCNWEAA